MKLSDIYDDAIIIVSGHYWDFWHGAEAICGACGYVFSSNEAEERFLDGEIVETRHGDRYFKGHRMYCIQCDREFKQIYYGRSQEILNIVTEDEE